MSQHTKEFIVKLDQIKEDIEELGLTKKEVSDLYNIPYTVVKR